MTTTLLTNGTVIDGTGAPRFDGDVLLEDGRVAAVVRRGNGAAPTDIVADVTLDARGMIVAPGFIDMHAHHDWLLPHESHPELLAWSVAQGVTTVVQGNCGLSPAPVRAPGPGRAASIRRLEKLARIAIEEPVDYSWGSVGELLDRYAEVQPLVNVAQLVGHAAIRYAVADTPRAPLTPDEQRAGLELLRQSLAEGACGVSFGLGYDPGMYAPLDELAAFVAVAAAADKPAVVHLKAYSWLSPCYPATSLRAHNVRALEEALDLARATGVRLQLSHFIFVGRRSWRTAPQCLALLDAAQADGVDVMIDAFPYTCGNTTVDVVLPYWFLAGLPDLYRSRSARARLWIEIELASRMLGFTYDGVQVMHPAVPEWAELAGQTLAQLARRWRTSPLDALLRLSERSRGAALMLFHFYSGEPSNEQPLASVLARDDCLFESDAVLRAAGFANPAARGTFPRILGRYAREQRLFSLEEAVRRMTAASAERFGLVRRGRLAEDMAADVVVFEPDRVADAPPVLGEPAGAPKGIEHVFINGVQVVKQGQVQLPHRRPGQVLRV